MSMDEKKGIIALDIDGTLTSKTHGLEQEVIHFLHNKVEEGWEFIFITGRPFQWGFLTIEDLPFPYAIGVQNGALLLDMPSKQILGRKYLSKDILPTMEEIGRQEQTDFVIYSGYENGDLCYYRPAQLDPILMCYLIERKTLLGEKWRALDSFSELPVSVFSSVKFFSKEKQAFALSDAIEDRLGLHAPVNRDPFNPQYCIIQATHSEATKGYALQEFIKIKRSRGPVIAAGDDHNDLSMLEVADIKIVMSSAPSSLLEIADIVAPSAEENGIIVGITEAIHRLEG